MIKCFLSRWIINIRLFCTHGWMTSRVACHHCLLTAHMSRQRRAWRAIIILGLDTRSNDVERGMASSRWIAHMVLDDDGLGITSSTLDSTHGRTMLGFACNHQPWTAHIVGLRWARHAIIGLAHNTWSVDVSVACYHRLWTAHTLERCWARQWSHRPWVAHKVGWCRELNAIIDLGKNTWLYYIARCIPSRSWTTHMVR